MFPLYRQWPRRLSCARLPSTSGNATVSFMLGIARFALASPLQRGLWFPDAMVSYGRYLSVVEAARLKSFSEEATAFLLTLEPKAA